MPAERERKGGQQPPIQVITVNRKARYDYHILKTYEAGLVLTGCEIKSIRAGRVNLRDSYAAPERGELWLFNAHIAPYPQGGVYNPPTRRPRKLLLHQQEIGLLTGQVSRRGLTIVPLRLYIKGRVAKVELALARGKKQYEKKEAIQEREAERLVRQALKRRAKRPRRQAPAP